MKNTTNQTFSEVYDVISHFEEEMQEKIPKSFINVIKKNRDLDYEINIDYSVDIKKQLLKETKIILSLIYRDYLCSKEKREELLALDLEETEREEKILQKNMKLILRVEKKKMFKVKKKIKKINKKKIKRKIYL